MDAFTKSFFGCRRQSHNGGCERHVCAPSPLACWWATMADVRPTSGSLLNLTHDRDAWTPPTFEENPLATWTPRDGCEHVIDLVFHSISGQSRSLECNTFTSLMFASTGRTLPSDDTTRTPSGRKLLQLLIGNKIENNRPASNYRHYSLKVENMRACCRYTRRRPDRTHGGVLNVHTRGFLLSLFSSLFLSLSRSFLPLLFSSLFSLLFSFLSPLFLFPFLAPFLLLLLLLLLLLFLFPFYSLFSSLPFTPTHTVQSTDQHVNVIWRTAGAQQSVLSPPPLHSLLPLLPLLLLKK